MIIELYGLPAVGKTTLARKIKSEGVSLVGGLNLIEVLLLNLEFILRNPQSWLRLFWLCARNSRNTRMFYLKLRNVFLLRNAKVIKARKSRGGVVLIDEGHLQNLLSVPEFKMDTKEALNICKNLLMPDIVFVLTLSPEQKNERSSFRGFEPRGEFGSDYVRKWQENLEHNNNIALKVMPRFTRVKVIGEDTSVEEVISWISKHETNR